MVLSIRALFAHAKMSNAARITLCGGLFGAGGLAYGSGLSSGSPEP